MIVDWRLEAIHQCVAGMGIRISSLADNKNFTLQFDDGDALHLDLDEQDCIRASVRHPLLTNQIEELMDRLLRFNYYKKHKPLQPWAYLLDESLVLRIVLTQAQVMQTSLSAVIEKLRAAREHILDVRYV